MDPLRTIMARHILNFDLPRDRAGRLCLDRHGRLPGLRGRSEAKVIALIEAADHAAAEAAALAVVARYTGKIAGVSEEPGIEFVLRDICWVDGPKAANEALQRALDVPVTGQLDAAARAVLRCAERVPHGLLRNLAKSRAAGLVSATDERRYAAATRIGIGLSPRRFAGDGLKAA